MKNVSVTLGSLLLLASLCAAQDASPAGTDQDSGQSVVAAASASRAQVKAEQDKQADIRHLLEITGAAALAMQTMDEMEKSMKPMIADSLPPGDYREKLVDLFFEKFQQKCDPKELVELIVPIYDKYYTAEEIKGLIRFYESPLGQKTASTLPKIAAESQAAGGQWGREIGREAMLEVLAEHPEMRRALQDAKANLQPPQ
jgi:hypothetical protein